MTRMRFPAVALPSALLASAALAALTFAAPATAQAVPGASTAKINDIQVSRDGDNVSILVKLSQQPSAASAKSSDTGLVLEVDGLQLTALNLTPPAGSLVTGVAANSNKVTLTGAALGNATTVIYRNAVLIEAKLAEPAVHGASLLAAATPAPQPPVPQATAQPAAPAPQPAAHPAPPPAKPAPVPAPVVQAAVTPPAAQPHPAPAQPVTPTPVALTPSTPNAPIALASPAAKPKEPTKDLESHITPAAAPSAPAAALPTASIAGVNAARCTAAAAELAKDAWALAAMGDQALCLLDAGKFDEAKSRLDQLAAITPLDWRIALGLAALHDHNGEKDLSKDSWLAALDRAPNDEIKAAIKAKMPAAAAAELKS